MGGVWLLYPPKTICIGLLFNLLCGSYRKLIVTLFTTFGVEVFILANNLFQDSPGARLLGEHQFSGEK
jgi:hypothetical protein